MLFFVIFGHEKSKIIMEKQDLLFDAIKALVDPKKNFNEIIAEALNTSKDAAYRRIKGLTTLSFDEGIALTRLFNIPSDKLGYNPTEYVFFQKDHFIKTEEGLYRYFENTLKLLEYVGSFPNAQILYSCKDIPIFYQFRFRELGMFKMYVWLKSIYNVGKLEGEHYSLNSIPKKFQEIGYKLWKAYTKIPTVEIWNDTSSLSLVKQIEYFWESGMFKDQEEALLICEQVREMIRVIYKHALLGNRTTDGDEPVNTGVKYSLYVNDLLIMDNHVVMRYGPTKRLIMPYAGLHFINTLDEEMTENMYEYLIQQTKRSAQISNYSEKERNKFFIRMRYRLEQVEENIKKGNPFI